ncbi:MAG TPA: 2-dehydropantoate 2-reductase N-terminal domain-containing protein, partial [Steroidobacteraceae bacterium]|nr:2-dehydropantoate 2-reductase N-terminal domain-containing protein [Steroidobacteraceae bacterium]
MGKHIAVIGAGAVGGYVGAFLTEAGSRVSFIDPWPEHIDHIKRHGITVRSADTETTIAARALHIHEVQTLTWDPIDIALVAVKSFDTAWATALIAGYLSPAGYAVSMQNGMNEQQLADVVGWDRVLGCIVSGLGVKCTDPGQIYRFLAPPTGSDHAVFRIGEIGGACTMRATELAAMLGAVDRAIVTPNLWGERWTKLITNSFTHGVLGASGQWDEDFYRDEDWGHRVLKAVFAESISVGRSLGYEIGSVCGAAPDVWL